MLEYICKFTAKAHDQKRKVAIVPACDLKM